MADTQETPPKGESKDQHVLSHEAVAEMQRRLDELQTELAKARTKAEQQEGRARKAEAALKADKTDVSSQLDELNQRLAIETEARKKQDERVRLLTDQQKRAAIAISVADKARALAEGAAGDLIALLSAQVMVDDSGHVVVRTETGAPRISAKTGKAMTVDELRDEYIAARPYLQKPLTSGGAGSKGNTEGVQNLNLDELEKMTADKRADYLAGLTEQDRAALVSKLRTSG